MKRQDIELDVVILEEDGPDETWADYDELGIIAGNHGNRSRIRHTIVGNRVHRNLPGV